MTWFIVVPVLVLALIGFYALQQDRQLAESEGRDRAERLANDWVRAISEQWDRIEATATNRGNPAFLNDAPDSEHFFEFDADGRLLFPPDYAAVPDPKPFDLSALSPLQHELWSEAQMAERIPNPQQSTAAYQRLLQASVPPRFEASARFAMGCQLAEAGSRREAVAMFAEIAEWFAAERSESGVPLGPLADLKHARLGELSSEAWLRICSNAVFRPSMLTPSLLSLADQAGVHCPDGTAMAPSYQALWTRHEVTRAMFRVAIRPGRSLAEDSIRRPSHAVAFSMEGKERIAIRLHRESDTTAKMLVLTVGSPPLRENVRTNLAANRADYFGVTVGLAGTVIHQEGFPGQRQPHLGSAIAVAASDTRWPVMGLDSRIQDHVEMLRIHVHLADAASFYSHHRRRTAWFSLVIGLASLTALFGWRTTRRAFLRQQQLNEMKSNFISSVSHELRAPIASLRLMAEGLESGRIKEEAKKHAYFSFIVQECRRLGSLIENVLDFSRIEQGRKEYEFEPTDAAALVRHTVELMNPCAGERSIKLNFVFDDLPPSSPDAQPVLDGRAIQQALLNLIDNALKHSPKGSTVIVGLNFPEPRSRMKDHGSRVTDQTSRQSLDILPACHSADFEIWVEDHGEGISPQEHERIFERFYRLGSELRRETQGVGIGLSIVKHIVEAHDGRVTVQSAIGQGSRFTMRLPMNQLREADARPNR